MIENTETSDNPLKKQVLKALQRVLTPLIRFALSQGVNYSMLHELLKLVYVQVAEEDFKLAQRQQTDSRISLLTGLHRKDVHRLRSHKEDSNLDSSLVTLGSQLVGLWISDKDFLTEEGNPKPLPRLASSGGKTSFESLVARVSKDIRARPVLDEWLRVGVVHIDEHDQVCLNVSAFVPNAGFEEKLFFFQHNIHDHIAATAHNLMNQKPPMLERCVYYENLSIESINELKTLAERIGMDALKAVNARARELQELSSKLENSTQRFTFALYLYNVDQNNKNEISHTFYRRKSTRID